MHQEEDNVSESQDERNTRRDPLADLEARIDAAIEEVRPKVRKAMEELDARVDAAVSELRPRVENAMDDVRPRVDRFLAEVQPRLDSALERIQARIAELRKDLEERAARREQETAPVASLPRSGDTAAQPPAEEAKEEGGPEGPGGSDAERPDSPGSGPYTGPTGV